MIHKPKKDDMTPPQADWEARSALQLGLAARGLQGDHVLSSLDAFDPLVIDLPQGIINITEHKPNENHAGRRPEDEGK